MNTDELYTFLIRKGFRFAEIRKLNAYQIRNIIQKAAEQDAEDGDPGRTTWR